jgi:hypothetical protein
LFLDERIFQIVNFVAQLHWFQRSACRCKPRCATRTFHPHAFCSAAMCVFLAGTRRHTSLIMRGIFSLRKRQRSRGKEEKVLGAGGCIRPRLGLQRGRYGYTRGATLGMRKIVKLCMLAVVNCNWSIIW